MVTGIILVSMGVCLGGAVSLVISSAHNAEVLNKLDRANKEEINKIRNDYDLLSKQVEIELNGIKNGNKSIEIEEV